MKNILVMVMAVVVVMIAMTNWVNADPLTLTPKATVKGTVLDKCTTPTDGEIIFNIDPAAAGPIIASTTTVGNSSPSVKCTKGSIHTVECTSALSLKIGGIGGTDPIPYTITGCAGSITGAGFSTAVEIPLEISIASGAYQDALAGEHSDDITVTVTY